jgi:ComF family protein
MHEFIKHIITPFSDFLFPPLCFVCDRRLENGDVRVCMECWSSFRPFNVGDKVWYELNGRFTDGGVGGFLSCFYFEKEGKLQEVIHLLKYRGIKSMGVMLGREIGKRMRETGNFYDADYLVPIPLHKLKLRERGYNQSEMLCRGIREFTGIPVDTNLIRRRRYTQSQTQLDLKERKQNVEDAFEIPPKRLPEVQRKTIILVDDVITTGSTMIACAREFVNAGTKTVLAVSAAVAE